MFVVELAAQNSRDSLFMQQIADERLVDSTAEQRFDNAFYAILQPLSKAIGVVSR